MNQEIRVLLLYKVAVQATFPSEVQDVSPVRTTRSFILDDRRDARPVYASHGGPS